MLFSGIGAAAAVADDLEQGFFDRLRSLPIPRSSVLAGRAIADTAILTLASAVTVAIGFAVGFRLHGSLARRAGGVRALLVFGFAFEWLFICIGPVRRQRPGGAGHVLIVFPLAFVSSAYVPVESMPGWLQAFAEHQPLTYMVDAVRGLTLGSQAEARSATRRPTSWRGRCSGRARSSPSAVPLAVAK